MNCDDGNASTSDFCSPSGCVNAPLNSDKGQSNDEMLPDGTEAEVNGIEMNATIPESESGNESIPTEPSNEIIPAEPGCDDGNPCTTDTYDGTNCVYTQKNCDDENPNTIDACNAGICVNELISGENNSTSESASLDAISRHHPICDDHNQCTVDTFNGTACVHSPANCDDGNACTDDSCDPVRGCVHAQKNCSDGNSNTFDYCYEGTCVHTPTSCNDMNSCTVDTFNGTACVHIPVNCDDENSCSVDSCDPVKGCTHIQKNCADQNACTIDICDSRGRCTHILRNCEDGDPCTSDVCDAYWGCIHTPLVCGAGMTCVNGGCLPISYPNTITPSSYSIPAGSAIALPWGPTVTALDTIQVENGVVYAIRSPLTFVRILGGNPTVSPELDNILGQEYEGMEMVGLTWQNSPLDMKLIKPDGSVLSPESDSQNIKHVTGSNYDYYFLRRPISGYWTIGINPTYPSGSGEGFSLISGLVRVPIAPPLTLATNPI